jgi:UDPglucose--hexose-1-phosphate uridylyltransferase
VSELRKDPITGHWVVIAEGRTARPNEYAATPRASSSADCPFCEGNEKRTPPEISAIRRDGATRDGPGWTVRTIPNRFPTLEAGAPKNAAGSTETFFEEQPGYGHHEVIVESPKHEPVLPFLESHQAQKVIRIFRDRIKALAAKPRVRTVVLFENYGPESGGTLMHPHAQIVGAPVIPPLLAEEVEGMRRFARKNPGACLLEKIGNEERRLGARVVVDDDAFLAITPFASRYPYEILLMPQRHSASITEATDAELTRLAELLPALLRAELAVNASLSYNFFIHVAPNPLKSHPEFHWHVEITPRLVRPDGFELGTGITVNPVSPEAAAPALRAALAPSAGSDGR